MKVKLSCFCFGVLCILPVFAFAQNNLLISEFVAANHSTLADEDGDYPDWIEIWNAGANAVNLEGWYLTDNAKQLTKWRFPATNLNAGAYLVVFASDKDRRVPGARHHANFQLSANGEYLALVGPDATNVAWAYSPVFPSQVTDVAFGIITVGNTVDLSIPIQPANWRYFPQPTPGQANRLGVATLGAVIGGAEFAPAHPMNADDIHVTARVRPGFGTVTNVSLVYRVMFGNEVVTPMYDDGTRADGAAGDGVYGASIPAAACSARQMVRWYISATDTSGAASRWPIYAAGVEAPQYLGTVIGDPSLTTQLPLFQYFIQNTNWYKLPNNGAYSKDALTNASVYYAGRFYDNVRVRIRGASSVLAKFPKQSLKFDFNPGERFVYSPDREPVAQANVNQLWTDKAYVRNYLSMQEVFTAARVPADEVVMLLTYLNGNLHSAASFVEEPDERFLSRNGLDPDGALYKMYNPLTEAGVRPHLPPGANPDAYGGAEKKTREWEDFSDLQALVNGIKSSNPSRTAFMFDNLNVPEVINYFAASLLIQDWDRYPKNHFLYRDTLGSREWQIIPWDADLSWGYAGWLSDDLTATHATFSHPLYGESDYVGPYGQWHALADALYRTPVFRQMFLRRARTLMEEILQPPGTSVHQLKLEQKLDALQALMGAEVDADKNRWGVPFGAKQTLAQALGLIKNSYLAPRRTHLFVTHGPPNGLIPASQFAYSTIRVAAVEFNPASGNQAEEYLCLTNSNAFAVDMTGWRLEGGVSFTFQPGTVMPSNSAMYLSPDVVAFRARKTGPRGGQGLFVAGNYQGQLSARGEALRLLGAGSRLVYATNYTGFPSLAQQFLRVVEIMYHPAPLAGNTSGAEEFEFIKLKNISAGMTLDLKGVRFANGLTFDFTGSAVTTLAPGHTVLVVKNRDAFAACYGTGLSVAGPYGGSLDNGGERLQLLDGMGEEILDFRYEKDWHPITDGLGFSLVVVDENAEPDAWNTAANWRAGGRLGGFPSGSEPVLPAIAPILINEALTRPETPPPTDSVEFYNPTAKAVDLGGWFLTDDFNAPRKYRIPDRTIIGAGGYLLFDESDFNAGGAGFALGANGDELWLFSGDGANLTGYAHGFDFGAADVGVSFGRLVTSDGREHFAAQATQTLGATNAGPRVGPVVITEIMYHPPGLGANGDAADPFIELLNIDAHDVPLFDPLFPTNPWKISGAVDFLFPAGVTLAPGACALVVNFDPTNTVRLAAFRANYGVDAKAHIFGPYRGKLTHAGGQVDLKWPTMLPGPAVAYVLADRVKYTDSTPWPAGADGWGLSLQRLEPLAFGNEPANWRAAPPTPAGSVAAGAAPIILAQSSQQTVPAFNPVLFSVTAEGAPPLSYQWRCNGNNLAGATNSMLTFSGILPEQAGDYQVIVFNASGSVLSSNMTLEIITGPVITQQPASQTIRLGLTATFTVAAVSGSGTPLRYQWHFDGVDLPGKTNTSLALASVQTTNGGVYSVLVTDSVGAVMSVPAALNVVVSPAIGVQPVSQSVVAGGSVTFTVLLTNGSLPMHYQWRFGSLPVTNFLLNSHASFFTLRNVQTSQAGNYRVVITNAAQPSGYASSTAALTVLADADGDGIPDLWTQQYFGHATGQAGDHSRAADDADGDGMLNGQEYIAGTDPANALSCLQVDRVAPGTPPTLQFVAVSNRTYSVEYTDGLGTEPWWKLADFVARANTRLETVSDPLAITNRFYRLVTPRSPTSSSTP